jgi:hypothetical protein
LTDFGCQFNQPIDATHALNRSAGGLEANKAWQDQALIFYWHHFQQKS